MNKTFFSSPLGGILMIVIALSVSFFSQHQQGPQHAVAAATEQRPDAPHAIPETVSGEPAQSTITTLPADEIFQRFDAWLQAATDPQAGDSADSDSLANTFVELAKVRHQHMSKLIKTDPQKALRAAVSFKQYASLPAQAAQWVEQPFSTRADLVVLPNEPDPSGRIPGNFAELDVTLVLRDGEKRGKNRYYTLYRYGNRASILSKDGIATQGIALDGVAAIQDAALSVVAAEDSAFVQQQFPAVGDKSQDFYTGEAIQGEPVMALAGGRLFHFASEANVGKLNRKLAQLEAELDPKTGSQILFVVGCQRLQGPLCQ